jgi:dCMP deaminase
MSKILPNLLNLIKDIDRLDWDEYFLSIAFLISSRSACNRLKVGSVITKDNRILAAGYNGFIPGAPHISRVREGREMATIHSEVNAISDAAKRGVNISGAKIYITHYPCINCFKSIVSSGINEIVYHSDYNNDNLVQELAQENNIKIIKLNSK